MDDDEDDDESDHNDEDDEDDESDHDTIDPVVEIELEPGLSTSLVLLDDVRQQSQHLHWGGRHQVRVTELPVHISVNHHSFKAINRKK